MNYAEMSDLQINIEVARALGKKSMWLKESPENGYAARGNELVMTRTHCTAFGNTKKKETVIIPDYCNNPEDAWPIIVVNKIALIPECGDGSWWAIPEPVIQSDWRVDAGNNAIMNAENPLRAAMVVFLMMKEGEAK